MAWEQTTQVYAGRIGRLVGGSQVAVCRCLKDKYKTPSSAAGHGLIGHVLWMIQGAKWEWTKALPPSKSSCRGTWNGWLADRD